MRQCSMPCSACPSHPASLGASLQGGLRYLRVKGRLAGEDLAGRVAHVGAVKVEADAASQHLYILLTEAGVGAGGAGLGAVEAGLDALNQCLGIHGGFVRVRLDHPSSISHVYSFPRVELTVFEL